MAAEIGALSQKNRFQVKFDNFDALIGTTWRLSAY